MKIKKGDKVKILAGKDRGKTGKVLQVFPAKNRASVEGLNLLIKHLRPRKRGETGQRVEFPAPISLSNLILLCPKCGQPARVGYKYLEIVKQVSADLKQTEKKKIRLCRKCKQAIN